MNSEMIKHEWKRCQMFSFDFQRPDGDKTQLPTRNIKVSTAELFAFIVFDQLFKQSILIFIT